MGIIGIWATKQHPHDMFLDIFLMVSFLTQKGSTSCGCAQHNWINTFQQANAFLRTRIRQADDPRGTFVHSLCWQVRRQHVQCATSGSQCSYQLHALCASKILEKVSTGVISHLFLMPLETERNEWTRKKTLHKHAQTALNRRKHQEHLPGKVKLNHDNSKKCRVSKSTHAMNTL